MKKLVVILIVILLGIFLLNAIQTRVRATIHADQTMGLVFGLCDEAFQKFTDAEWSLLYRRCGEKDILNATRLIELWGSLLRVATASGKIINER